MGFIYRNFDEVYSLEIRASFVHAYHGETSVDQNEYDFISLMKKVSS